MKLLSEKPVRVESIGVDGEEHQFQMEVSSKAFSILVDKLYTNKIGAVIRELSTNAYEAHQMNGNETEPFLVKLPSAFDLNFTIRDYGTGLSEQDVYNLYTVVFKSTKTNSNDVGGAFGLGSKAPLSYTKNFVVNSYHNKKKYVYSIYINELGIPSCKKMAEIATEERNGLEIIIPVSKDDIHTFKSNAEEIYKWFKVTPNVTGQNLNLKKVTSIQTGDGWFMLAGYNTCCYALMGNVAYKIDQYGFSGKNKNVLQNLRGIVMEFNIGEIEPEPSRESISFNKSTINTIDNKIDAIKDSLDKNIKSEIDKCKTYWDAYNKFIELNYSFSNFNVKKQQWKGKNLEEIKCSIKYRTKHSKSERTLQSFRLNDNDKFYIQDAKNTVTAMKFNASNRYFVVNSEAEAKQFSKELFLDVDWIKSSTLPKPTIKRRSRTISGKVLKLRFSHTCQGSWEDGVDIPDNGGYYVEVVRNKIIINGKEYTPMSLYDFLTLANITTVPVFGVKKSDIDKFKNNKKWKEISELINNESEKIKNRYITEKQKEILVHGLSWSDRDFIKSASKIDGIERYLGVSIKNIDQSIDKLPERVIIRANSLTGFKIPEVKGESLSTNLNAFYKKYPLLKALAYISDVPQKDIVDYINSK